MYRKNLVTTLALATMIAVATTGCNKETTISALDTAQEVVASVEEKTVEKAVADNIITSVDKTTDKKVETLKPDEKEDVKVDNGDTGSWPTVPAERNIVSEEDRNNMSETEMTSYFNSTSPDEWDIDLYGTHFVKYDGEPVGPKGMDSEVEFFCSLTEEEETRLYDEYLTPYYVANPPDLVINFDKVANDIAKEYGANQSQEYDGPRPTGSGDPYAGRPTGTVTWQTTNTRGNIS